MFGLPLTGKSAESVSAIAVDSVINLSDDYGQTYQSFANRQRVGDSYVEANTLYGGLGVYIAPIRSTTGCSNLFSNKAQTGFAKNDCSTGVGSIVNYTVAAGLYTATSQNKADSIARAYGQAYANTNGNCAVVDTTFMGIDPYCITSTADSGTPNVSDYNASINYQQEMYSLSVLLSRSSGEAVHDATISYAVNFNDGSSATYTAPMYKDQLATNISPPLGGYGLNSVISVSISSVTYTALNRRAYTNRKRYLNGVADGYQEANSAGTYYLAPVADPGACGGWFYNTAQTGFIKNDCSTGPGSSVSYTVAAHTDSSTVSQSYADVIARIRGQAYANAHGNCLVGDTIVTTVAGNGHVGYIDGSALSAEFLNLNVITSDNNGNIYLADADGLGLVRKFEPNGTVSTVAGSILNGYVDSVGTAARFTQIFGLASDISGNIFVSDVENYKIRKVTPTGVVSTIAGSTRGFANGQGTSVKFAEIHDISIDLSGNIYVNDAGNHRIRLINNSGLVTTFAGSGANGYLDGPAATAKFGIMYTSTVDKFGNVYVYDSGRIRKISGGVVSTIAGDGTVGGFQDGIGNSAKFGYMSYMITDAIGNLYACDSTNDCIRKITPFGVVTTITTHGTSGGYIDGLISTAKFDGLVGIAIDNVGDLYVSDHFNNVIRKITFPKP